MVDYKKEIGTNPSPGYQGYMMIRDTGTAVEFWVIAGSSSTSSYQTPYSWTINGNDGSSTFNYPSGGKWLKLRSWNVTTDQRVRFYMGDSNTSGLGGPATLYADINRSSAPPKPNPWQVEYIENVRIRGDTDGNENGGLPITRWQVGFGRDPDDPTLNFQDVDENGYGWITGLYPDVTYYFWVRAYNAKGWSPWSNRTSGHTETIPDAPTKPTISAITQTSLKSVFYTNGNGGSLVVEWQTGYGTDSSTPQKFISDNNISLTDLDPGQTYYFWGRGRNKWGWGPWSSRATATLLSGGWVDVNGVKKRAVPYVNVNGVWKVATVYVKIGGLWEGTG